MNVQDRPGRRRYRYVLVKVYSDGAAPDRRTFSSAMKEAVQDLFGVFGVADISPTLIDYFEDGGLGIVRCQHLGVARVCAALAFITEIEGRRTSVDPVHVSGLLNVVRGRLREMSSHRELNNPSTGSSKT